MNHYLTHIPELFIGQNITDSLCKWPTSGVLPSLTWHDCLFSCMDADGCYSFNYNQAQESCVLVVPTSGQEHPMAEIETGWDFYV